MDIHFDFSHGGAMELMGPWLIVSIIIPVESSMQCVVTRITSGQVTQMDGKRVVDSLYDEEAIYYNNNYEFIG